MLFDERDLRVFDNNESRQYFKEILQCYYSQNYRATTVMLYSFVIYDLFMKLQDMEKEGDKKAKNKVKEIKNMIADDKRYSEVETEVISFFKENCQLYFKRFAEDIDYLKNCRNKCAHLKVDDDSLYVPNDYHVRMLICSMYDNVLSVKAPFIMDLFPFVESEVETLSETVLFIRPECITEGIRNNIKTRYLKRMTYDSLLKSYRTFIRLLFVSEAEESQKYLHGLYAFTYTMSEYMISAGFSSAFAEEDVIGSFSKIKKESMKKSEAKRKALLSLVISFPAIMDLLRTNEEMFEYMSKEILSSPSGLSYYRAFFPRQEKSMYDFFKENPKLHDANFTRTLYNALKEDDDFEIEEFLQSMVKAIPTYYGFDAANSFMSLFKDHLQDISIDAIEAIMKEYEKNSQCKNRNRHEEDYAFVMKFIEKARSEEETAESDDIQF